MSPEDTDDEGSPDADPDVELYDSDPVVQQLSDVGQRIEIMLEGAGGPFVFDAEDQPTDLPSDLQYQRALTQLADQVQIVSHLRRTVLRDDEDAASAEEEESPGAPESPDAPDPEGRFGGLPPLTPSKRKPGGRGGKH